MKKYFLTTALMGTFIAPAFGADKIITSANTCTVDVLGVSDNNAVANTIATWDLIDYTLDPGEYLNVTDTSVTETTCPAGSYCVGGGFTVETAANSIAQCPTTHPNSATGAGADTQCYTACTVATANIAHATAVSGNDYYGTGVDTCGATACETGYHVNGGGIKLVEKDPLIPVEVDYEEFAGDWDYIEQDGSFNNTYFGDLLTERGTWATGFVYGIVQGRAICRSNTDPVNEYLYNNYAAIQNKSISMDKVRADITALIGEEKADVIVDFVTAYILFQGNEADWSNIAKKYFAVTMESGGNYTHDSAGQYCYCQMDSFTPTGGTKEIVTSAPWVFNYYYNLSTSSLNCVSRCAYECAAVLADYNPFSPAYRMAVYGALGYTESGGICAANTINIDWNPDNNGAHTINQCTYEGAIEVPADPVKPGYTFTGWKLVE